MKILNLIKALFLIIILISCSNSNNVLIVFSDVDFILNYTNFYFNNYPVIVYDINTSNIKNITPDILITYHNSSFFKTNDFDDISKIIGYDTTYKEEDFLNNILNKYKVNDKINFIPLGFDVPVLLKRKDPSSNEKSIEISELYKKSVENITEDDKNKWVFYPFANVDFIFYLLLLNNVNFDGSKDDGSRFLAFFKFLKQWYEKYKFINYSHYDYFNNFNFLDKNMADYVFLNSFWEFYKYPLSVKNKYDVVYLNKDNKTVTNMVIGASLYSKSKNKIEAIKFLEFLFNRNSLDLVNDKNPIELDYFFSIKDLNEKFLYKNDTDIMKYAPDFKTFDFKIKNSKDETKRQNIYNKIYSLLITEDLTDNAILSLYDDLIILINS